MVPCNRTTSSAAYLYSLLDILRRIFFVQTLESIFRKIMHKVIAGNLVFAAHVAGTAGNAGGTPQEGGPASGASPRRGLLARDSLVDLENAVQ